MGVNTHETDTGGVAFMNDADGIADFHIGGPQNPTSTTPRYYGQRVAKYPLAAGVDSGGGILAFQPPTAYSSIATFVELDITTVATASCTLEVGTGANATAAATSFIAAQDVHTATGTFNSGMKSVKVAAGNWITVSTASGASTGLVGNVYVHFHPV